MSLLTVKTRNARGGSRSEALASATQYRWVRTPNIDADWVIVCTRVREENPRCYVLTSGEVSKLANRDKRGPNYWLEIAQYDTEEFAERWDRIKPSNSRRYTLQPLRWQKPE